MGRMTIDSKKSEQCFLDVVGADVEGTFRDSLTYQQSSSVAEISIAGQTITGGNLQIAFRDEGVLLNLDKTKICFQVKYTTTAARASENLPMNALQLFRPTSVSLGGSIVWNIAEGEHFA
jgi:hypothetical protein